MYIFLKKKKKTHTRAQSVVADVVTTRKYVLFRTSGGASADTKPEKIFVVKRERQTVRPLNPPRALGDFHFFHFMFFRSFSALGAFFPLCI